MYIRDSWIVPSTSTSTSAFAFALFAAQFKIGLLRLKIPNDGAVSHFDWNYTGMT